MSRRPFRAVLGWTLAGIAGSHSPADTTPTPVDTGTPTGGDRHRSATGLEIRGTDAAQIL